MRPFSHILQTPFSAAIALGAASLLIVSCGNKTETGYIAPPATTGPGIANPAAAGTQPVTEAPATADVAAAKPFELRAGEQLANYKVQKGDSLWKIGKTYGVSSDRIRAANGMTSDLIKYGSTIKVPVKGNTAPVAPTPAPAPVAPVAPVAVPQPAPAPAPTPTPAPAATQPKISPPPAFQLSEPKPVPPPTPPAGGLQFSD